MAVQMQQPGQGAQWMQAPQAPANCPPGLEYLAQIDQLLVHQQVELLEAFTGFETNNKYEIKNSMGQRVYFAAEDTECCTRNCCGPGRPFDMQILDNSGREVIHLKRPLRCSTCWCPCCLQKVEVSAPPGNVIGYVQQAWSVCVPKFKIQNAQEETVLCVEGPCLTCSICGDVEFQVLSADGSTNVGKISKQWTGLAKEMFTDADNFGMTFPMDLDVNIKAVLLGAVFLIVNSSDGQTQVGRISKQWSGLVKELFTDADNFGVQFPADLDVNIKAVMLGAVFLIDFMFFEKEDNKENTGVTMM